MSLSEQLLMLIGYVLAHGAYSVSDLPEGELLVPLAITQTEEKQQQLIRFEAETQKEAVKNAFSKLDILKKHVQAWALARESIIRTESGNPEDYITVDAWEKGQTVEIVIAQKIQPFYIENKFLIVGDIQISINGNWLSDEDASKIIPAIQAGIEQHPKYNLWQQWKK